jgi:hypothetical protein
MFGTLVVVLPSEFKGGELHLWNNAYKEPIVKLAGQREFATGLAAWLVEALFSISLKLAMCGNC